MKFWTFLIALSVLLTTGVAVILTSSGMGMSMNGAFDDSSLMATSNQVGCPNPLCPTNSIDDMTRGECLVHCISAYTGQFDFHEAVVPTGFSFVLLALVVLFPFLLPKLPELRLFFDRRRFSNAFSKLLLHGSLASVVIRD